MNNLFKKKYFPFVIQIPILIVFILIVINAIGVSGDKSVYLKILRNTNLSNLIVWSFWWPMIVITAVVFGRWWCTICPMELVTSVFSIIGLKRKPSKFMRNGWVVTILYGLILIFAIQYLWVHRIPNRMAIYLIILFLLAVVSGLVWEKRTFCNYICPVGHLLGLYSMLSIFGLKPKSRSLCKKCETRECTVIENNYRLFDRSCTSNVNPRKNALPTKCISCTQCVSVCPHDNLHFTRKNNIKRFKHFKLKPAQAVFIMMVSGFLIPELLEDNIYLFNTVSLPIEYFIKLYSVKGGLAVIVSEIYFVLLIPFSIFLFLSMINKLNHRLSFRESLNNIALLLLPVVAVLHAFKGMTKIIKRVEYLPLAFKDIKGVDTANALLSGSLNMDHKVSDLLLNGSYFISPILIGMSIYLVFAVSKNAKLKYANVGVSLVVIYALIFSFSFVSQVNVS